MCPSREDPSRYFSRKTQESCRQAGDNHSTRALWQRFSMQDLKQSGLLCGCPMIPMMPFLVTFAWTACPAANPFASTASRQIERRIQMFATGRTPCTGQFGHPAGGVHLGKNLQHFFRTCLSHFLLCQGAINEARCGLSSGVSGVQFYDGGAVQPAWGIPGGPVRIIAQRHTVHTCDRDSPIAPLQNRRPLGSHLAA